MIEWAKGFIRQRMDTKIGVEVAFEIGERLREKRDCTLVNLKGGRIDMEQAKKAR